MQMFRMNTKNFVVKLLTGIKVFNQENTENGLAPTLFSVHVDVLKRMNIIANVYKMLNI